METTIWQPYQDNNVTLLGIINTPDQELIDNFVAENSITFPILFDPGSSGGVQGGDTYDDYYMPNDGSPYPRDFIVDQEGILQYANNEIDTEWMHYVLDELIGSTDGIAGDVNNDSLINILDVIQTVNIILGTNSTPTDFELWAADMNQDGNIDILDVVTLANCILVDNCGG
ncbi:MAG: redoxin domain-containing protein [Candidatus Marinimicrobia bacterium]|nr:redoxin domain-containing protein [Candidatus Neomarinimicrobiota bacterium]